MFLWDEIARKPHLRYNGETGWGPGCALETRGCLREGEDLPAFEELPLEKIREYEAVNTIWIDNASFTRSYMIWFTDRDDIAGRDGSFIEVVEYKKNDNANTDEEWTRVWIRHYDKKTLEVSSESKGNSVTPAGSE